MSIYIEAAKGKGIRNDAQNNGGTCRNSRNQFNTKGARCRNSRVVLAEQVISVMELAYEA